jgi:predicted secreted protein
MPASQAQLGFGTILARGGTAVIEVIKIAGPIMKADMKETTNMGSPNTYKEFVAGLKDGGTITIEGNYIPKDASQLPLKSDFDAGTVSTWTITLAGSLGVWTCSCLVQDISPAYPLDDRMTYTATLKINGKPTLA